MSVQYGFEVCRVCLVPDQSVKLKSMFEGRGKIADWFQLVSGCSISDDRGKHDALICPQCSKDVKAAFDLRENIRRIDVYYFQARRDEPDDKNFERDQTAVEETSAATVSMGEVKRTPTGSAGILGQVQRGLTESFVKAAKPDPGNQFKCHVCEKNFLSKRNLRRHIEGVHEKIKKYVCDFCPTKYVNKRDLRNHTVKMHTGMHMSPAPESFPKLKCDFNGCKKSFQTSGNLQKHQKSHSSDRNFTCSACLKTFKWSKSVKRHQKKSCTLRARVVIDTSPK